MLSLKKTVLIYACAFAVAGVVPFILLPVLTKHLSPAQFGEVTSFLIFSALLAKFSSLSTHGYVAVQYFKIDPHNIARLAGTSASLLMIIHILAAIISWLAYPVINTLLNITVAQVLLAVLAAFLINLNLIWLAIFQSTGHAVSYLNSRLIQGALESGLCIAFLLWLAPEASARTSSYAIALAASALFGLSVCLKRKKFIPCFEITQVKRLLAFGLPLLPHVIAGTTIIYLDRLVVSSLLGSESLGLYMVAMQIGMILLAITEPMNKALAPWLFKQLAKNDNIIRRLIVRRTYQLFIFLAIIGLLTAIIADIFFEQIFDIRYQGAKKLIPWMAWGFVMQGMYTAVVNYLFFAERTGWLSIATGCTAIVGSGVSWAMANYYGIEGASMSFALNNTVMFLIVWIMAGQAVPMPWLLKSNRMV